MDTHITHLEPEPSASESARLPDEPDLSRFATLNEARTPLGGEHDDAAAALSPRPKRKRRGRLLAGVSLGVIGLTAAGAFLLSPWNTLVPVPPAMIGAAHTLGQKVAHLPVIQQTTAAVSSHWTSEPVLAPAARMASTRTPERPAYEAKPPQLPETREQTLNELLALDGNKAAQKDRAFGKPDPSRTAAVNMADIHEPGAAATPILARPPTPPRPDITAAVTHAALNQVHPEAAAAAKSAVQPTTPSPVALAPAPAPKQSASSPAPAQKIVSVSTPTPVPSTAKVTVAAVTSAGAAGVHRLQLKAGPMTTQEQTDVLQAVTELSNLVQTLKIENAALRKDVSRRMADQDNRLADFDRRVSLAEARAALRAATDAGKPSPVPAEVAVVHSAAAAPIAPPPSTSAMRVSSGPTHRTRYRVQAASPGLALLAEVDRGGGDGAQIQVAVGDTLPGYGVVKSVAQKGPNWVVQTEQGAIQ